MADPMRIRAQAQGNNAIVRVLMSHEMETGQRKDAAGKTIPAWHIS
ncbi:MAG TPA: thiosulfate oxidation carrier complex protein SoxZ, partial [Ramlibacter sp.]|nr:thiosulfate oxidation carrier complex protein SoxZ [Ramlibacter sp.]